MSGQTPVSVEELRRRYEGLRDKKPKWLEDVVNRLEADGVDYMDELKDLTGQDLEGYPLMFRKAVLPPQGALVLS